MENLQDLKSGSVADQFDLQPAALEGVVECVGGRRADISPEPDQQAHQFVHAIGDQPDLLRVRIAGEDSVAYSQLLVVGDQHPAGIPREVTPGLEDLATGRNQGGIGSLTTARELIFVAQQTVKGLPDPR